MIRYQLACTNGHGFESWFRSAADFDRLAALGRVSCGECGSTGVTKALMAPAVRPTREAPGAPAPVAPDVPEAAVSAVAAPALATRSARIGKALEALKREVEKNADYVGPDFAAEARAIHEGEAPERAIYGEAHPDEARRLIEDGVPVAPLPFVPTRKAN